jgi:hypothetical protein
VKPIANFVFDTHALFVISDSELATIAQLGGDVAIAGGENNGYCYNDFCANTVCVAVAKVGVTPDVPDIPDTPNLRCWMNNGCPPL